MLGSHIKHIGSGVLFILMVNIYWAPDSCQTSLLAFIWTDLFDPHNNSTR